MRCSSQPTWKLGTSIYSNTEWDPDIDEPIFQAVAQYTCPEGYVFEIYQHPIPDPDINFGLIVEETDVLNVTCAPYGLWEPLEVPPCIRKFPISCWYPRVGNECRDLLINFRKNGGICF